MNGAGRRKRRHGPVYRAFRALLVLVIVLVAVAIFLLSTVPGGRMVAMIANRLGTNAIQQLEIDSVTGILSGRTRIGHIIISDAEGVPWLALRDIAIDWSPAAVFTAGLAIDRLSVGHAELTRLPEGSDEEPVAGGSFTLPLNIDIKSMDLPEIVLGEAVAGTVARFELAGALKLDAELSDAFADLDIERTDGVGGKASIDATLNLPEQQFDLNLSLSEPAGGVLAHLAGLPDDEAVAIMATSSGSLADWALTVTGDIDGERTADAELAVRAREAGHAFNLEATGALGRFLPPIAAALFEGDSELVAAGLVEPERAGIQIDALTLDSASLHAEGQGRIARTGDVNFTADVGAAGDALRLTFGEADNAITISARRLGLGVEGAASDANVTFEAEVPEVESAAFSAESITASGRFEHFDLASRAGSGTVSVRAQSAGAANAMLARALAGDLSLDADLSLEGSLVTLTAAKVRTATAAIDMEGALELTTLQGEGTLSAQMNAAVVSERLVEIAGRTVIAQTGFSLAEKRAVSLTGLQVESDNLTAAGDLSLDAERTMEAAITAELADLAVINPSATGTLSLDADISGPLAAPEVAAAVTGSAITVEGQAIEDLRLTADAVLDADEPRADVELSGTYRGQPIVGKAQLASRDGRNEISPLVLTLEENRIEGALTLDENFLPTGTIELHLPEIGPLAALALMDYSGSAEGNLVFDVEEGVPSLVADIDVAALSGTGFSLSGAGVTATVENYTASPALDGRVTVTSLDIGKTAVSGIAVDFFQEADWTRFDAVADAGDLPLSAEGRVRLADGETRVELDAASLTYQGLPVTLDAAAAISVRNGMTTIEELSISPGGGTVTVSGTSGEELALDVRLSALPLGIVERFAPGTGLTGTISGTVDISGTPAAPVAEFDLQGSGVSAAALSAVSTQPLSVSATGAYRGDKVDFRATAGGSGGLRFDASGNVGLSGAKPLSIRANGTAPLSLVSARLASQGLILDGAANIDLTIGGTAQAPDLSGTVTAGDIRFVDTNSGIVIEDLAIDIGLDRQTVRLRSLSGALAAGGDITGSGTIGLDAAAGYPADLQLKVSRGRYSDGQLVATNFDADLTLQGPLTATPTLGGTLRLDQTTITVPSTLPSSIAELGVTHRNAGSAVRSQAQRLEARAGNGAGGGLGLDLTIEAPRRIFVRGRGIDAEFGGSLVLRGTTGAPMASGSFDLVRGRLTVLGKRLDFDRGHIGFSGTMIPSLDFAASTTAGSAVATVLVTGLATSPEFTFTSVPSMPEDEVLALIVFGRSISDLSPLQIAQLAQAAAELTGVTSGGGIVEQLRKATGIDDLDLRTDEKTGDTSVAVGKYLNDRTYIGIEKGTSTSTGRARIDLEIGRGLKLRGEASTDGETKGGIFFERDY